MQNHIFALFVIILISCLVTFLLWKKKKSIYSGMTLHIVNGDGAGQALPIVDVDIENHIVTLGRNWEEAPGTTSEFEIKGDS